MKRTKRVIGSILIAAILMVSVAAIPTSAPVYANEIGIGIEEILLLWFLSIAYQSEKVSIKIEPIEPEKDPTLGRIENRTDIWTIEVLIDGIEEESREDKIIIPPGQIRLIYLDIGEHIVQVWAYVRTIFGRRLVGVYNQEAEPNLYVDGRMLRGKNYGWRLQLRERNFDSPN